MSNYRKGNDSKYYQRTGNGSSNAKQQTTTRDKYASEGDQYFEKQQRGGNMLNAVKKAEKKVDAVVSNIMQDVKQLQRAEKNVHEALAKIDPAIVDTTPGIDRHQPMPMTMERVVEQAVKKRLRDSGLSRRQAAAIAAHVPIRDGRVKFNTDDPDEVDIYNSLGNLYGKKVTYWNQAGNLSNVLSAWDLFTLNRAFPGSSNAPYVNNMTITPIPTGVFHNSFSITTAFDSTNGTIQPLGTRRFTILCYCPSLSAWGGGPGVANHFSTTTRLGGFFIFQTSNPSDILSCSDFTRIGVAFSSIGLYGSDFTSFASGGAVWAGSLHTRLVCPAANLVGSVYKGVMTFNQLGASPSVNNLMQNAQYNSTGSYDSSMRSAVVQPSVIEDITSNVTHLTTTGAGYSSADNEIVSYIVYQDPVVSINTGVGTFTLLCNQEGNYAYYPKMTDPLAFSLGQSLQRPVVEEVLQRHPVVNAHISPLVNKVVEDTPGYRGLWATVKGGLGSLLAGADSALGGTISKLDNNLLGGAIRDNIGFRNDNSGFLSGIANAAGKFLGGSVNGIAAPFSAVVSSLLKTQPAGPIYYGREELLYTARQSREVLQRQVNLPFMYGFQNLLEWYDEYIFWLHSQPDLIPESAMGPSPPFGKANLDELSCGSDILNKQPDFQVHTSDAT